MIINEASKIGGQDVITPLGLCFSCGKAGHYQTCCPHRKQGDAAARSGAQGPSMPRAGAAGTNGVRRPGDRENTIGDRISPWTWSRTAKTCDERSGHLSGLRIRACLVHGLARRRAASLLRRKRLGRKRLGRKVEQNGICLNTITVRSK